MSCPKGSLPQPLALALRTRCRALYEAGSSFADIESETGVKAATARSWKARDKWTRASESSSELVIVEPQEIEIPDSLPEQAEEYEMNLRRAAITFSRFIADLPGASITAKSQHIKAVDQTARKALRIESEKPLQVINIGVLAQSPSQIDEKRSERAANARRLHSLVKPRETLEVAD